MTSSGENAVEDLVRTSRLGSRATITLCRGGALNALSWEMIGQLRGAVMGAAEDASLRAVTFASESPRAFCVGADLREFATLTPDAASERHADLVALLRQVRALPMLTVAAVSGAALGGGFELALSCDVVIASQAAAFGLPETRVGLIPSGGGIRLLAQSVGLGRAREIALSGRALSAREARDLGIVAQVATPEHLDDACSEFIASALRGSPLAVRLAKQLAWRSMDLRSEEYEEAEAAAWREARSSPECGEGVRAFAQKRAPTWDTR